MKSGTTYHICLDISGLLKRSEKSLDGLLERDGKELNGAEVKAFLREIRATRGYSHFAGCSNMNEKGRCAGHRATEPGE